MGLAVPVEDPLTLVEYSVRRSQRNIFDNTVSGSAPYGPHIVMDGPEQKPVLD